MLFNCRFVIINKYIKYIQFPLKHTLTHSAAPFSGKPSFSQSVLVSCLPQDSQLAFGNNPSGPPGPLKLQNTEQIFLLQGE